MNICEKAKARFPERDANLEKIIAVAKQVGYVLGAEDAVKEAVTLFEKFLAEGVVNKDTWESMYRRHFINYFNGEE